MKKIFVFISVILLLTSCEDPIQVKLDKGSKLIVVDAFISDIRKDQVVRITYNDEFLSGKAAPVVQNATVILEDITASVSHTLVFISNQYVLPIGPNDTIIKINHDYKLHVFADGIEYTAESRARRTAVIDSIQAVYFEKGTGFGPGGNSPFYSCYLFAKDKVDFTPDYYWLKTYRNDTLFNTPNDINLCIDGTNGVIRPEDTDGADSLTFTPPATFLGFKRFAKFDKVRVEIHSINKETYNFMLQAQQQLVNGGLFATTPENVKTNMITPTNTKVKAVGWFCVSVVNAKERLVN